jgi:uncharacterized protein (DUF1697 family)
VADRWYVFLRAINTGNRRLTNEQLLAPFVGMGFDDVAAYQAAGNVAFTSEEPPDESRLEDVLADTYGFETPTFVRLASEVAAIVGADAFTSAEIAATAGKVQVAFLRREPTAEKVAELVDLTPPEDLVRVVGREWYWLPTDGTSGSTLPVGRVEALLGEMTMRTLGTVARMSAKFGG